MRQRLYGVGFAAALFLLTRATDVCLGATLQTDPDMEKVVQGLPAGKPLIPAGDWSAVRLKHCEAFGYTNWTAVADMPFAQALQVVTTQEARRAFLVQLTAPSRLPLAAGDVGLMTFAARTVQTVDESGEGTLDFVVRQTADPYTKLGGGTHRIAPEWRRYYAPFTIPEKHTYEPGQAEVCFSAGFLPQTIEIADLRCVTYGHDVAFSVFPVPVVTYPGREPDAPWRQAAAARIEQNRKGDLTVRVVDGQGKPVAGAEVRVRMVRHAFPFGCAFNAAYWDEGRAKGVNQRYADEFVKTFNLASDVGALKWPQWEEGRQVALDAVDWLRANGLQVRGHNLIWPRWDRTPMAKDAQAIANYEKHPDTMRKLLLDHIRDEAGTLGDKIVEWDVINEPWTHYRFTEVLGDDVIVDWFRAAHAADPGARLVLNEAGSFSDPDQRRWTNLKKMLARLQAAGVPQVTAGFESHWGAGTPGPEAVYAKWDEFAKMGLQISLTEFDQVVDDEELQGDWERDFLTLAFSHPAVESFCRWGFWNGVSKRGFINQNWSLKPNGKAYRDLVFKQWWTDERGSTAADGSCRVRGFLGLHDVTVTHGGEKWIVSADLVKTGATVVVTLTPEARQAETARRASEAKAKAAAIAAVDARIDARHKGKKEGRQTDTITRDEARARVDLIAGEGVTTLGRVEGADGVTVNAKDDGRSAIAELPVAEHDWKQGTLRFTPSADGIVQLGLMGHFVEGTGAKPREIWVYFDDVKAEGAVLENGSFEQAGEGGRPAMWTGKAFCQAKRIADETGAKAGKAYAKVCHGGIGALRQDLHVKQGQTVTLTFWARSAHPISGE